MPYLSEDRIASIVERVVSRLQDGATPASLGFLPESPKPAVSRPASKPSEHGRPVTRSYGSALHNTGPAKGVFTKLDDAAQAARAAFTKFSMLGLQARYKIIEEMRRESRLHVEVMSRMALEETGMGRYEHKLLKNQLVIDKTPGPEALKTWAQSGDDGLTLEEYAPYGVIGAITPTTNPTETIICNGIGMLAAGNSVVFNVHPGAKKVSAYTVSFLNEAIIRAGGPENLLTCIAEPTIESAQELMHHPQINLLVVTGGPGVVDAAMKSPKKTIAAGPGNPPVVVDETADILQAAEGVVKGVSVDNNIVCVAEKEIITVSSITDELKKQMKQFGAYEMSPEETARMVKVATDGKGHTNKTWVGKDASLILREIGVKVPDSTLVAYAEVPEDHPFVQIELLMPVTGMVRVGNAREAIKTAVRVEQGNFHSASMYSKNIENLHTMARAVNTSIFTKNTPTYSGLGMGGEGYTSFTIASPTGEGLTDPRDFSRVRRCVLKDYFRIV